MPNTAEIEQLRLEIESLRRDVEKLRDHQHLGTDGSVLLQGSTPILAQSLGLIGSTIKRGDFLFTPFNITDGQVGGLSADVKQRLMGMGIAITGGKGTSSEQVNALLTSGLSSDPEEANKPTNQSSWDNINFSQLSVIQSLNSSYSQSGPSFVSPTSFLIGERTPGIKNGVGSITSGGSTLSDSTANFQSDKLILSVCNIFTSSGSILASYRVLSHTSNVLTLGQVNSDGSSTIASLPQTGSFSYEVRTPMLLGASEMPWERLYVGEDIRLGYGSSGGSQVRYIKWGNGSPEGVVTANTGSLYLRFDGSTSTSLYIKTSGSGATGWTAK